MTLIVALKSDDGVILAGDKRAHTGNNNLEYNDNATKVFKLNDKVAIGGAGDGYDAHLVIDELLKNEKIASLDVDQIATLAYQIATNKQTTLVSGENAILVSMHLKSPPQFGFLIIGYDSSSKPKIYSITNANLTPREIAENNCAIGVNLLADYINSTEIKNVSSLEDLEKLAIKSIKETSKFVTAVSSTHNVIKISKD